VNAAGVATTDTIYRGWMREGFAGQERGLAAAFHNSLTLLTAEVEGRSFGGGVLELVPSEIARLAVPFPSAADLNFQLLQGVATTQDGEGSDALIQATNDLLIGAGIGFEPEMVELWEDARRALQARRFARAGALADEPCSEDEVSLIAV